MPVDSAFTNTNIVTMNRSQPVAEALAIRKGRIVKVGTNEEISQLIDKNTKVFSLEGKTVVPGFIDTHIHVLDFGKCLSWLDLNKAESIEEMKEILKERAKKTPKGRWIIGRGWDHTRFKEQRLPNLSDLDAVSPDNPVILYHRFELTCVVNTEALRLAGVTRHAKPPSRGSIDKVVETGELTGVLRDAATDLVWSKIPEPSEEELVEAAALACAKIAEAGITSVHWMILSAVEISVAQKLLAQGKLPIRVYLIIPANLLTEIGEIRAGDNEKLRLGGALISADGYLSDKTAALVQPYNDEPKTSGKLICSRREMTEQASKILQLGLQLVIHAAGDKAVDAALTVIEKVTKGFGNVEARFRLDQAALLNPSLIERLRAQRIVVLVQPCVAASEFAVWQATERLGPERARWLYPLKTLLNQGVKVAGGSDCPMEPLSPLLNMQKAVIRESVPEERVTVDEALRMFTIDAAYSSSEENIKGSIEEGKLADLTVLSDNPSSVSRNNIEKIGVEMTVVNGKIVFRI